MRFRWLTATIALPVLWVAMSSVPRTGPAEGLAPKSEPLLGGGRIRHIVIIDQENHSFDNVLGKLCVKAGLAQVFRDKCDGVTQGKLPDGSPIPLGRASDIVPEVAHTIKAQQTAIDGGKMDGFALMHMCGPDTQPPYQCYTQFSPEQIPNVASLARSFVISDRTFEMRATPSWAGHMALAAATIDGFEGDNPTPTQFGNGPGWGCDSYKDARWSDGGPFISVPSCIPNMLGQGPYRPSPVSYVPTIFDRLDAAGQNWKIYGGTGKPGGSGYAWTICPTFYECLGSSQSGNVVRASRIITDAQYGRLPKFTIVTPIASNSQHNRNSMALGDNWIGSVVSAIENGPDWSSTAIFLTWDDCGCFYDHVPPPNSEQGIRVPMIIISPFAKPRFTDSNDATFASLLAFAEHTFGLPPLTSEDATAYDYHHSFNFKQAALAPVPMTQTAIPAWERRWLATHPGDENDGT